MKKRIVIWSILVLSLFLTSCKRGTEKIGKGGVGMFELTTYCSVSYGDEKYEIRDSDIVSTFSEMCDKTYWKDADEVGMENCNLQITFEGARATLYINTNTSTGYLNDIPVEMTDEIMNYISLNIINGISIGAKLEFVDDSNGVQNYIMDIETQYNVFVPRLELDKNNETFSITHDVLSSTIIGGTYEIEDNMLVAKTDDNKSTYQFEIVDSKTLKFIQNNSSEISLTDDDVGIPISDGSIFKLQK